MAAPGVLLLAALALVLGVGVRPAAAEIDDTPRNFWGVSGQGPAQTNNVNSQVWAIKQIGNVMYVGGKFTDVRGGGTDYDQQYLAAFEASTGRWLDWWTPSINAPVYALEASPDGSVLYVGGEFTNVNGTAVNAFAALEPLTGELKSGWSTRVSGGGPASVKSLNIGPDGQLYIGGSFGSVAKGGVSQTANGAVRVAPNTGDIDAGWKPVVSGGGVWDMAFAPDQSRVYLGGYFTSVNGAADTKAFAAVQFSNGGFVSGVNDYEPNYEEGGRGRVHAVAAVNDLVFVAGEEHSTQVLNASNLSRRYVHFTGQPRNQGWALQGGGDFQELEVVGNRVYASCHCWNQHLDAANGNLYPTTSPGPGTWRNVRSVVAYNASTGKQDPAFSAQLSGVAGVWAMEAHSTDGCIWFGGQIGQSNGRAANNLIRLCDENGPGPAAGPPVVEPGGGAPAAPANCSAQLQGNEIGLTWAASANADSYVVRRSRNGGSFFWLRKVNSPAVSTQDANIVSGSTYAYTVEALNADGTSATTTCGSVTVDSPTLNAPTNCTTEIVGGSVATSWSAVAGASSYVVRRQRDAGSFFWLGRANAPATSLGSAVPQPGSSYTYTVEAVSGGQTSPTAPCGSLNLNGGGGGAAVAPVSCTAENTAAGTYEVNWTPAANDNANDYVIRRSRNGGTFYWTGKVTPPTNQFTNTGVPSGQIDYSVEARGADGSVAVRNCTDLGGNGGGNAVAPVSCTAAESGASTIAVSWVRAADDKAVDFVVRRSRNGGTFYWTGKVNAPGTSFTNNLPFGGTYLYTVEARAANGTVAVTNCGPAGGVNI